MASIYIKPDSPYYWLRFFDKYESDKNKKRKSFNTKISVTRADLDKYKNKKPGEKIKLGGNKEVSELVKQFEAGVVKRNISKDSNIKFQRDSKILSEGFAEFIEDVTRIGDKKSLKKNTIELYKLAVDHFIKVNGDHKIYKYSSLNDFNSLLVHFEELDLAQNTRAIYTKHLHRLWNYFIAKGFTKENIIEKLEEEIKEEPEDIPIIEMVSTLNFYKRQDPDKFDILYFMLLTMTRPSSAIVQEIEWINFKKGFIKILNVKSQRKKKPFYVFPLFKELKNHLKTVIAKRPNAKRLFENYPVDEDKYTSVFKWWYRDQRRFKKVAALSNSRYDGPFELKQIRKTFPTYAWNQLDMSEEEIRFLLDHASEDISKNYYINKNLEAMCKKLDAVKFVDSGPLVLEEPEPLFLEDPEPLMLPELQPLYLDNELPEWDLKPITVEDMVKGWKEGSSSGKLNDLTKEELIEMLEETPNITHLAKKLGVSDCAIHKKCKKWNIEKPSKSNKP